jgi:hypothetical protein
MFDNMWKGIFLVVLLLVGDPFVTLKAQTVDNTDVSPVELAHNTPKSLVYVL